MQFDRLLRTRQTQQGNFCYSCRSPLNSDVDSDDEKGAVRLDEET